MNTFDALLILLIQNLEQRINDVKTKKELLEFGLSILPETAAISSKVSIEFILPFEAAIHSLSLLNEDDDASVVRVKFPIDSGSLMRSTWFSSEFYELIRNRYCEPGSIKLKFLDVEVIQEYIAEDEYSTSLDE